MALESFYGGKPGFSPVIKARFKYINNEDPAYGIAVKNGQNISEINSYTMDECFSDPNYTDVWYGELCIIDTDSKMNPNNGKLYRRTLKKVDDDKWIAAGNTLYAEYIGQIVGPSGGIPNFDLGNLDIERQKAVGIIKTLDTDPSSFDISNWEYAYPTEDETGKTVITNEVPPRDGANWPDYSVIQVLDAGGTDGSAIDLVPGKDGDNFNDTIKYTWCNVHRNLGDSNTDAWFYLGFQIPYTSFDVNAVKENYTYNGNIFIDKSINLETGKVEHPFYRNYEFHIPKGARGIGPEEIFCVNPKDENSEPLSADLYTYDAISYNQENDQYTIDTNKKINKQEIPDSYWVGKWCIYNSEHEFNEETDVIYIYLGSYKDVRGVNLATDGTLTFTYSDNTETKFIKKLKWIDTITFNTDRNNDNNNDYGKLDITFNNGDPAKSWTVPLIKNISVDDDTREIKVEYTDKTDEIGIINSIDQTWVDPRGHLLILYTSSEYRPITGEGIPNGPYYQQLANPNDKYSQSQIWVKGTATNKIAETDSTNWWHDLGVVSTSTVTNPKIVVSYDAAANEPPLTSIDEISSKLGELYQNGNIEIDGTVIEGGLIAVENIPTGDGVTQDEGDYVILPDEGNSNSYETRIFYYDYNKEKWTDLGPFGSSGNSSVDGNSNIYLEGYKNNYTENDNNTYVSDDGEHIIYSLSDNGNPELYFTSNEWIAYSSDYGYVPSGNIDNFTVLGNGINLFSFTENNSNDIIDEI